MEQMYELLFALSSAERINILFELQKGELKLSHLSRKLKLSVTDAARQLQRLSEDKLVKKNVSGLYGLTQFGVVSLSLLSGFSFILHNRDYFLEYDASSIPYQFINRVGDLEGSKYVAAALKNLEEGENKIREAREFIWILSDQVLASSISPLAEKLKTQFELRIILPDGMFPPESKSKLPASIPTVQKRVLPKVNVIIVLSEKYAVFCLPSKSGKMDYTGFSGEDPRFYKWCKDMFLYYWEKAKPLSPKLTQ